MKIAIAVHNPTDTHALRFTQTALEAGHEVPIVFFFHDAVRIADSRAASTLMSSWQALKSDHDLDLAVCIAAAARRGLLDESAPEAASNRIPEDFSIVGLGQLIGAMAESDRLVTFAA